MKKDFNAKAQRREDAKVFKISFII